MSVILVAGAFQGLLEDRLNGIVNKKALKCPQVVQYIEQTHVDFDIVFITDDGGVMNTEEFVSQIKEICDYLEQQSIGSEVIVATLQSNLKRYDFPQRVKLNYLPQSRLSFEVCVELVKKYDVQRKAENSSERVGVLKRFKKLFGDVNVQSIGHGSEGVSRSINRVIAVTGHRGSGVTSTVVNLAVAAVQSGLSAIVVDFDIKLRGINMYFAGFAEAAENDENIRASLIRTLAGPHNFEITAYKPQPGFYITTLPYEFQDEHLMAQFFTTQKMISLISVLRQQFNLCVLDLPFDVASEHKELLINIDSFALCVSNNIYGAFSTMRSAKLYFAKEFLNMLMAKAKVVVSKYNPAAMFQGESLTPQRLCELLRSGIGDMYFPGLSLAGYIPYESDFDAQIESDLPIVNTNDKLKTAYNKILIGILEGVN